MEKGKLFHIGKKLVTVQHPHLTSPSEGEETFFPRPWREGLGEGRGGNYYKICNNLVF